MRKIDVVAVSLAFILIGLTAAVLTAQEQTFEAPKSTVGDRWEFVRRDRATYTMTIVEVSETGSVATATLWPDLRFHADHNGTTTKVEGDPSKITPVIASFANGWQWLQFPLHVGKKWSFDVQGSTAHFTVDVKVKKLTTVKTKAGTFEALHIDTCWRNNDSRWSDCGYQYWYAPSVKRIVKRETPNTWTSSLTDSDYQLVSYTLAGQ
jgi:hypothetical protein